MQLCGFELVLDLMQSTFLIVVVPLLFQVDWTGIMPLTLDRPMVSWFGILLAWAGHLSWGSLDQTLDQLVTQFLKKVGPNCCLLQKKKSITNAVSEIALNLSHLNLIQAT